MVKFLQRHRLPTLTEEETGICIILSAEIINNTNKKHLPTKKTCGPETFPDEFYKIFKEETIWISYTLIQKTEERKAFPTHFSETSKDKDMSRKGNYRAQTWIF